MLPNKLTELQDVGVGKALMKYLFPTSQMSFNMSLTPQSSSVEKQSEAKCGLNEKKID